MYCRSRFPGQSALRWVPVVLLGIVLATPLLATPPEARRGIESSSAIGPVDVNRATADELTAIPGIGTSLARRIVAFRDEHGPFRRIEDLLKVRGIGEKSLEKIRPHVTVGKRGAR